MTLARPLTASFMLALGAVVLTGCGQQQPGGKDFASLVAGPLVRADGSQAPADALHDKTVLVYFSAHWCPPCRAFTPELVKAYDTWKEQGKPVELVFVSSDKDEAAMKAYMTETKMSWLAVPFSDQARATALAENWAVRSIPTLVVVAPSGKTLSTDARMAVGKKKAEAIDDWIKP